MQEREIVMAMSEHLHRQGFLVALEVPNLYRSADIAAVSDCGVVWVLECKVSCISRAIAQSRTHKLAADKVFIVTPYRNTKESTIAGIRDAGIGLIYLMPDGRLEIVIDDGSKDPPWEPAKKKLVRRIMEGNDVKGHKEHMSLQHIC